LNYVDAMGNYPIVRIPCLLWMNALFRSWKELLLTIGKKELMSSSPITAIIVGAGHRAIGYADYAHLHPDELHIVGVADPVALRREQAAGMFGLTPAQCFASAEELAQHPRLADAIINGTMDHQHVPTALPLLSAGYDMLLEKPFATNEDEMWQLVAAVQRHHRWVLVCHVLRYTPFYTAIRRRIAAGDIGEIINIQTTEHVSYHHLSVGFVRGKWNNAARCHSTMLMAKCCHDLDLLTWMKSGIPPRSVASFGNLMQFRADKMPPQAGTRCLVDCPIEADCRYSARKLHLDHPDRWAFYAWDSLEDIPHPTVADKIASLATTNPHGRCAWRCDNDVVDHQSMVIMFADGCTATHNMVGGAARPCRSIHLLGTHGEIQGTFEENRLTIRRFDQRPGHEYAEELVDVSVEGDMQGAFGGHGGGDQLMVADFVRMLRGEAPSISTTHLEDSISGHVIGFCADRARVEHRVIDIQWSDAGR